MDIQSISNNSSFIYKPTQEIHDKQVPEYDFGEKSWVKTDPHLSGSRLEGGWSGLELTDTLITDCNCPIEDVSKVPT